LQWKTDIINRDGHFKPTSLSIICESTLYTTCTTGASRHRTKSGKKNEKEQNMRKINLSGGDYDDDS